MSSSGLGEYISEVTEQHKRDPLELLQILRQVQSRYSCVSSEAMEHVAAELGVSLGQVRGAVEFYSFLHTAPRGQYEILLSDSITDHMLGKQSLMDYLCERLGVSVGETRTDGRVSVDNTSCTGMCDQGPAGLVNGYAVTNLSRQRIDQMVELIEAGTPLTDWPREFFEVRDNIRREDALLGSELEAGAAVRAVLERGEENVLAEITRSGLRGLGGAGFKIS